MRSARNGFAHTLGEYWLGHTGGVAARYNVGKQRLPPELIEEMRSAYARAVPLLDLETPAADKTEQQRQQLQNAVALLGADAVGETLIGQGWKFVGMIGGRVVLEKASARAQG